MSERYELLVVGAGPGGYVSAIRAKQLGINVAIVERRSTLGGVCLNEGCIPSKALLDSSEHFATARDKFAIHGIEIDSPRINLQVMLSRKNEVVRRLTDGVAYLLKKHKIPVIKGEARLLGMGSDGDHRTEIVSEAAVDAVDAVVSKRVLLATGSEPVSLPCIPFDGEFVVGAREALDFDKVPEHLVVAGAGFIGLELGSVWRRLGARVTVLEMLPAILPTMDRQAADLLQRTLKKQGMEFRLGARITGLEKNGGKGRVTYQVGEDNFAVECDRLLVSIGRRPLISGTGFTELGGVVSESGRISVDENYQTSIAGIYAIGDLVPGPMLAHKASEEGIVCVERMTGKTVAVDYTCLPGVVYTWPEGASTGKTEEQLKSENIPYKSGKSNFIGNGRARAMEETDGFVKILADAQTDRILGVHIVGPRASDLIGEAVTAMCLKATARDIGMQFHAHPTLGEAMKEAALDVNNEAIHG